MTHMHISAMVAPISRRGLQRSMRKAMDVISTLYGGGRIMNLTDNTKYTRNFDVPLVHLRYVERVLQHNHIAYRKESAT